ncbi:MAG: homoserine dehydrogenase [Candidatus Ranarchaeia archaeon]
MKTLLIGFGNVGKATFKVLREKMPQIEIVAITNSKGTLINPGEIDPFSDAKIEEFPEFQHNMTGEQALKELGVDLLIETTPTNIKNAEPGLSHIRYALSHKVDVVTSNKGPLAFDFQGLKDLQRKHNTLLRYEATVAASIPIFNMVESCLPINTVYEVHGVLNGTCNYILWKMENRGGDMGVILKDAQERGIAETDPSADIDGIDAAVKLVILTNSLLNRHVRFTDVKRQGIRRITEEAFHIANQKNETIRLIGSATSETLEVAPKVIPKTSTLNVPHTMNAVTLRFDIAKELTLSGYGAGGMETANAIVNDVFRIWSSRVNNTDD